MQHIDEGNSVKKRVLDFLFSFLNISILWKYITENCKLRLAFSDSLYLFIFALRATKTMLCFALYETILY